MNIKDQFEFCKRRIWEDYGHIVIPDFKPVLKYGKNLNVGTSLVTVANMEQDETGAIV